MAEKYCNCDFDSQLVYIVKNLNDEPQIQISIVKF